MKISCSVLAFIIGSAVGMTPEDHQRIAQEMTGLKQSVDPMGMFRVTSFS